MRITDIRPSSKCKDGSLVKEYVLKSPVEEEDIKSLERQGKVILKNIGENTLFTFSSGLITCKGMTGDTVIYVTHRKEDISAVEAMMNDIFG